VLVAELGFAVETEAAVAVAGAQVHFLAGEQGGGVHHVAQRHRARAARQAEVQGDFDRHRRASAVDFGNRMERQAERKIERVAHGAIAQFGAAGDVALFDGLVCSMVMSHCHFSNVIVR